MIDCVNITWRNGFGNQLFQYAALKSLSLDRGYEIKLSQNLYNSSWHGQKCLLNNFKNKSYESK